jgi:F0F1-type ATP synthase assembly protein I
MTNPGDDRRRRIDTIRTLGALSTVGFSFVLAVLIGGLAGYGLDRLFGFEKYPVFFLIFIFFGIVAGMLNVFRASKKLK